MWVKSSKGNVTLGLHNLDIWGDICGGASDERDSGGNRYCTEL